MTPDELVSLYEAPDSIPPVPALDGLEEVDWASLHDAYGPATKVPARLRALVSGTYEHQACACQDLLQTIWHQGTVYSATAAVIPFLYNLLEQEGFHDHEKTMAAMILATIAEGRPAFVHCENNPSEAARWQIILEKSGRSLDEEMAEGRRLQAEIRRQLSKRFDLLYPYLRHNEAEVRVAIASAIGAFPELAARALPDLENALEDESDHYVRKTLQRTIELVRMRSS